MFVSKTSTTLLQQPSSLRASSTKTGSSLHKRYGMHLFRICLVLLFVVFSPRVFADTARCKVKIENVTSEVQSKTAAKQIIEFTFEFSPGANAQRKHFELPDGQYRCTLAFFDLDSGTSLSCERKGDLGHTYVQSDRSGIREHSARNNLIFRDRASHFVLDATCK